MALGNFNMGVNGEIKKMSNMLKTADRRAKWTKIWDSAYYSAYMKGTFDACFLEFGLGSFGALCKISDSMIFETLLFQQFSSDFNQSSYFHLMSAKRYEDKFYKFCSTLKF